MVKSTINTPRRVVRALSAVSCARVPVAMLEMVGTIRPRISGFMNKFRKLGFIDYNVGLHIHSSLLNVLLHG
jgi:hypothetical protein